MEQPHRRSRGLQPPTDPRLGQPAAQRVAGNRSGLPPPLLRPPVDPRLDHRDESPPPATAVGEFPPPALKGQIWQRGGLDIAIVAVLLAIAFVADRSWLVVVPVLFLLAVPFEKLFVHQPASSGRDAFGLPLWLPPLLLSLPALLLRPLVGMLATALLLVAGFLLFDLVTYWAHRWNHEVPLMWRFHAVHHATPQLGGAPIGVPTREQSALSPTKEANPEPRARAYPRRPLRSTNGFRARPVDGALLAPPLLVLLAAGFAPRLAVALALAQVGFTIFLHANVTWRWQPLNKIVATPEFHHRHHLSDPGGGLANDSYSIFLPLWDLLFGTYVTPTDRQPSHWEPATAELRYPFRLPIAALTTAIAYTWTLLVQIWEATIHRRPPDQPPEHRPPELEAGPRRPPSAWRPPSAAWPPASRRPPSEMLPRANTWRPPSDAWPPS